MGARALLAEALYQAVLLALLLRRRHRVRHGPEIPPCATALAFCGGGTSIHRLLQDPRAMLAQLLHASK